MQLKRFIKAKVSHSRSAGRSGPIARFERLENRRLMSGGAHEGSGGDGGDHDLRLATTLLFSQAPTAVETGLTNLAAADHVSAPGANTTVVLGNSNGVETYSVAVGGGPIKRLTVDQNGVAVIAPVHTTTPFGAITNDAVTSEFSGIAAALGINAPAAGATVDIATPASGPAVYTARLTSSSSSATVTISIDALGTPVGNESVPLSTLPTAILSGLISNAPAGAAPLLFTTPIKVQTVDGVTLYSAKYTVGTTSTTVTVNGAGALPPLPALSPISYAALVGLAPAAAVELQTLATADGVAGKIAPTRKVTTYTEANGTVLYSVTLPATRTLASHHSYTYSLQLVVDAFGSPTVFPSASTAGGDSGDRH